MFGDAVVAAGPAVGRGGAGALVVAHRREERVRELVARLHVEGDLRGRLGAGGGGELVVARGDDELWLRARAARSE